MSIRVTRYCAICTTAVIPYRRDPPPPKVCPPCAKQWAGNEEEPWYAALIEEQDKIHNLNIQSYRHESPLSRAEGMQRGS